MKLFLSYATKNATVAEEIYYALVGAGHDVFFDKSSLQPGDNYTRLLHDAIEAADGFIFLISPESVQAGSYTLTELKYAGQKWAHPEQRVLPVMVQPTSFEAIPAYLKAVTILQPAGSIAAEVVESLRGWGKPVTVVSPQQQIVSTTGSLIIILLAGVLIAVALGTLFSLAYPRVGIRVDLLFLFTLVGVLLAVAVRGFWRFIRRNSK
jgi:hypothetical protein